MHDSNFCSPKWYLKSLEKAAIAEEYSETEFDLMNMIKNKKF